MCLENTSPFPTNSLLVTGIPACQFSLKPRKAKLPSQVAGFLWPHLETLNNTCLSGQSVSWLDISRDPFPRACTTPARDTNNSLHGLPITAYSSRGTPCGPPFQSTASPVKGGFSAINHHQHQCPAPLPPGPRGCGRSWLPEVQIWATALPGGSSPSPQDLRQLQWERLTPGWLRSKEQTVPRRAEGT